MRKCKYCGRELKENERCNCPGAQAMRRKVRMISIIAGVLVIAVIIIAIIVGTSSGLSSGDPSSETTVEIYESSTSEPAKNETLSTNTGTDTKDPAETTADEATNDEADSTETTLNDPESEEITHADPTNMVDPFEHFIAEPVYDKYNGAGTATVERNSEALLAALKPSEEDQDAYIEYFNKRDEYEAAIRAISIVISPNEDLSNGDEITVTVTIPEFLADKVMSTSKTFVVSGLPDIQEVDILSMFDFHAKGVSGEAEIVVHPVTEDEYLLEELLLIEPNEHLSSGDQISITVTDEYIEYLIKNYNIIPTQTTITRKVGLLSEYVASADQLPKNILLELAQQLIEAEVPTDEGDGFTYDNVTVYGCYFVTRKPDEQRGYRNVVDIIISYDRYYREEYNCTWYASIQFYNVTQKDGDLLIDYDNNGKIESFTDPELHLADYGGNYIVTEIDMTE